MILFDARWIGDNGIGRFAKEIANRLEVERYLNKNNPVSPLDPFKLSLDRKVKSCDVFLSPGYNSPLFFKRAYILTIHDLNHIDRSENSSIFKKIYYKIILTKLCKDSVGIFTVSEFSKSRIVEYFNIDSKKVFVVGNGISQYFSNTGDKIIKECPYILCVSNRKGHKNEHNLLKAFSLSDFSQKGKLILTGNKTKELEELIEKLNISESVQFLGKITDQEMSKYYRGAIFSIFPSLYEGFGLPIIESFSCGTPVITSNITSMPEIAGDSALLVDPNDITDIKNAIDNLMCDNSLRDKLAKKGLERAKLYSWDNVIINIKDALQQLGYSI